MLIQADAEVGSPIAPRGAVVQVEGVATRKVVQQQRFRVGDDGVVKSGPHPLAANGAPVIAPGAPAGTVVR